MRTANLPAVDNRYWIGMLLASIAGTSLGDFISTDLNMGFAKGLLPLAVALTLAFVAERNAKRTTELYYWTAIVLTRTAATNLADLATHGLRLDYAWLELALFALLIVIGIWDHSESDHAIAAPSASKHGFKALPKADPRYWTMVLVASTIGTTLGDFVSDGLGLGAGMASIVLTLILIGIFFLQSRIEIGKMGYWPTLIVVRTAGTAVGDFLSGEGGLGLGFLVSASCATFLLAAVLMLWPYRERLQARSATIE